MDGPSIGIKLPDIITPKQKAWGFVFTVALLGFGGASLYAALPWLTELFNRATQTFSALALLIGTGVGVVSLLWVLTQKQTWALGKAVYYGLAKLAAKTIAEALPQEMSRSYITDYLRPRKDNAIAAEASAKGQLEEIETELATNKKQISQFQAYLEELEARSYDRSKEIWTNTQDEMLFSSYASQLNFCEETTEQLEAQRLLFTGWKDAVSELRSWLTTEEKTMNFLTEKLIRQYEMAIKAAKVAREVGQAMSGDAMQDIYKMSGAFMERRIHESMGQVEVVMGMVNDVTAARKLKDSAAARQLLARIREAKTRTTELAAKSKTEEKVMSSNNPDQIRDLMKQTVVSQPGLARNRRLLGNS